MTSNDVHERRNISSGHELFLRVDNDELRAYVVDYGAHHQPGQSCNPLAMLLIIASRLRVSRYTT